MNRLAVRHDKPSLQLAPNDEAMEETPDTYTAGRWEHHIINHLISSCKIRDLGPLEDGSNSGDDSNVGDDENEPVSAANYKMEKRRGKQKGEQDPGNVLLQRCNGMAS